MVTLTDLRSQTSKDLAKLAKNKGVSGWSSMKKEELVKAILKVVKKRSSFKPNGANKADRAGKANSVGKKTSAGARGKATQPAATNRISGTRITGNRMTGGRASASTTGTGKTSVPKGLTKTGANSAVKSGAAINSTAAESGRRILAGRMANDGTPDTIRPANGQARKTVNGSGAPTGANGVAKGAAKVPATKTAPAKTAPPKVAPPRNLEVERSAIAAKLEREMQERERLKNLALAASLEKESKEIQRDRLILIVRDSYWLQAYWEITPTTVQRAKSSLEKNWRGARPVLRLFEVVEENDNLVEKLVREISIHSGVDTWYIDTPNPPQTYRAAIGYATPQGKFFALTKSNRVSTPSPNAKAHRDHWTEIAADCENVFAMSGGYNPLEETSDLRDIFEEKLKRPMMSIGPNHAALLDQNLEFPFEVDAQMVIYGVASPGASVTLAGEPVKVDPNGAFSIRMELPDKRQVLPVVACSRDGAHQRTTVLAIERNTKVMEAINIEGDD